MGRFRRAVLFLTPSLALAAVLAACVCRVPDDNSSAARYTYEVVASHPHDPRAFTQGLLWHGGFLYESTGLEGRSSVRRVALETGEVLESRPLPRPHFGEGLALDGNRLFQLTWKSREAFVYDRDSLEPAGRFSYLGEGWGLAFDGRRFIMSDGTATLRFLDRRDFSVTGTVTVTDDGNPVARLNELEWVDGMVWANVWRTDRVAMIDPGDGRVRGWLDLSGILKDADRAGATVDVLNGIAHDPDSGRLWVTGKLWPKLYEIRLVEKPAPAP